MSQFGTNFCDNFVKARYEDGAWQAPELVPLEPLQMHPASHVFHYASTCFEGFKAYRWSDGKARVFRLADHATRMQGSARSLCLPVPDVELLSDMVLQLVSRQVEDIPAPPSSLYLRPTLIGTLPNIGAAAAPSTEALLFVLASPVGDYFAGGSRPLKLLVDDKRARTTEQLGSTKTGGNYAAALGPTLAARAEFGVDQVLFCPDGDVQETGAANFLLISDDEIITKPLDTSFLHGMTRASILSLGRDLGYTISERNFTVGDLLAWAPDYEAALSGTAACLTAVGTLVHNGEEHTVRDGKTGPNTERLRKALQDVQYGLAPDPHGWLTEV
ncbi:MAG: branched-chain amino acid aminotransferase [Woeseiaceae bacterium]|nr:branched-chain amino acid aminotransferase [Woeseiaceae bacterium]